MKEVRELQAKLQNREGRLESMVIKVNSEGNESGVTMYVRLSRYLFKWR